MELFLQTLYTGDKVYHLNGEWRIDLIFRKNVLQFLMSLLHFYDHQDQ
jgi:hypothetical protein